MSILMMHNESIRAMAENRKSAGKIADYLATKGVMTTETEINKFLRDTGFVRVPKPIKSAS